MTAYYLDDAQVDRLAKMLADYEAGRFSPAAQFDPSRPPIEVYYAHTNVSIAAGASGAATIFSIGLVNEGFTVNVVNVSGYDWPSGIFVTLLRDAYTGNYFPASFYGYASATIGGLVSTTTQSFAGTKNFIGDVTGNSFSSATYLACAGEVDLYECKITTVNGLTGPDFKITVTSGAYSGDSMLIVNAEGFTLAAGNCRYFLGQLQVSGDYIGSAGPSGTLGGVYAADKVSAGTAFYIGALPGGGGTGGASGTDSIGNVFLGGIVTTVGTGGITITLSVGSTSITGGSTDGLLFDNGGVLGVIGAPTSGQILVGGSTPAFKTVSGDATLTSAGVLTLKNTGTSGTYGQVTTDAQGRVTSGANTDVAHGGTGTTSLAAHGVVIGGGTSAVNVTATGSSGQVLTSNGSSADPTFQTLASSVTSVGATSPLSSSGGTTPNISIGSTIGVSLGGTGATTLTTHGVLVGEGTGAIAATGAGSSGQVLTSNGASADPTFQALPTSVSSVTASSPLASSGGTTPNLTLNTVPVASGGTGQTSLTAHDVLVGNGTSGVTQVTPSTSGLVLTSNGTSADPSFQAIPSSVPTGMIAPYGGYVAPSGWLLCDGSTYQQNLQSSLYNTITFTVTGTMTGGSTAVTGLTFPSGVTVNNLAVGFVVLGIANGYNGTVASASGTSLTLSSVWTGSSGSVPLVILPFGGACSTYTRVGTTVASNTTVTLTTGTTTGITVGDSVSGSSLLGNSYVASITDSTHFVLNQVASNSSSGVTLTFTNSNFKAPNMTGRVPVGQDLSGTVLATNKPAVGSSGGEETHTLTIAEMPSHNHGLDLKVASGLASGASFNLSADTGFNTTSTGGGGAHNNLQPYLAFVYIIKT